MTDEEVDAFLDGRHTMNVATLGPGAHGVEHAGAHLGRRVPDVHGHAGRLRLQRDPRLTALVEDGDQYEELRGVELVGKGTIVEDRDRIMALGRSVFERYTGPYTDEMAPVLEATGAKRLVVKLEIESVVSWDHGKLGGRY